ncbi:type II secretion system protein GspL [Sphingomonas bacterium]|uniref:type II secretion system protein GspL n=1 Tax=Sphingomonas bacterium TaxID=1895847 RepID=UPI0020C643F9|nr:type II secretion system protein GspL [Sphingomonas bacterium]
MTTLLFLPGDDRGWSWMRIHADARVESGEGIPVDQGDTVAVAPADAVTLHWAELPVRSAAQATAAARILAGEASAGPVAELHVAVGEEGRADRPIGVVGAGRMRAWLEALAEQGIDPVAIVPAPMLLPRPEAGYVSGEIGGRGVVRGISSGFADEARLTDLVTGGVAPDVLDRDALAQGIAAGSSNPALDLRQGMFARRRRRAPDWALIRRLAVMALVVLAITLAIDVVKIAKYEFAAGALEERADSLARTGLPRGESVNDADRQLDERLARLRGPGQGFSATTAAVYAAVRSVPGSEITAIDFGAGGTLRVALATDRQAAVLDVKNAIEALGYKVDAGVFQSAAGRVSGEMTVSAP